MINCINSYIFISFDPFEKFIRVLPDGSKLIVPEFFEHIDDYGLYTGKMDRNLNGLETNSQTGYVIFENKKFKFKSGDKVFFHYLAIDYKCEVNGLTGAFINANDVFFTDNDGIEMCDGVYLGEQIVKEVPRTASGIWLDFMERPKECYIKLTHVPSKSDFKVGDVVFSIDRLQYPIVYEGKSLIKLASHEIVGLMEVA